MYTILEFRSRSRVDASIYCVCNQIWKQYGFDNTTYNYFDLVSWYVVIQELGIVVIADSSVLLAIIISDYGTVMYSMYIGN